MLVLNLAVWEGLTMERYLMNPITSSKFTLGQVVIWL